MGLIRDYLRYRKARRAWELAVGEGLFTNAENHAYFHVSEAYERLIGNNPWVARWIS